MVNLCVVSQSGVYSIGIGLSSRVDSRGFQLGQLLDDCIELVLGIYCLSTFVSNCLPALVSLSGWPDLQQL